MICFGFGMMNISAGFGTDQSFKANIKGIRSVIGMVVTKEEKTGLIGPGRVRADRRCILLIEATENSPKLNSRER
jgi:hypothetical protein